MAGQRLVVPGVREALVRVRCSSGREGANGSAMGVWALSLLGIATLVCAARKAGAVHDLLGHEDDREFH